MVEDAGLVVPVVGVRDEVCHAIVHCFSLILETLKWTVRAVGQASRLMLVD